MFTDKRSKKIILVAHCILNQNAKLDRCAHYHGAVPNLARLLVESGVGIFQLPCPEVQYLGLERQADRNANPTIEQEDSRIAQLMSTLPAREYCQQLAIPILEQIKSYQQNGFKIVGLLGVNGSPTCGIESNWAEGEEPSGPGVFIQEFQRLLFRDGIDLSMRGVKVYQPEQAIQSLGELICQ